MSLQNNGQFLARSSRGAAPASSISGTGRQLLREHLVGMEDCDGVAGLAKQMAGAALPEDASFAEAAWWAGLLHDMGKYSDDFQRIVRAQEGESRSRVEHSGHGAAVAVRARALDIAFAVAGHHAGLPASRGGRGCLKERTDRLRAEADRLLEVAMRDIGSPILGAAVPPASVEDQEPLAFDLRVRMLFSCLVDADRLDSAGADATPNVLHDAPRRLDQMLRYTEGKAARMAEGPVKAARAEVLRACLSAAATSRRLLSLTVPTGGGKTLAAMAFALRRAIVRPTECRRVIVVIPYLSIIEQNSAVYADAVGSGGILEHHSGNLHVDQTDAAGDPVCTPAHRLAEENWSVPIVVTTSVRFFESIFSNKPGDLRRLHNIARSVVILDEVQTMPRRYVAPLLSVIQELSGRWGTTFLFCTATQPAFERASDRDGDQRWPHGTLTEVMPEPARLYEDLKRVTVTWPGSDGQPPRWTWERVADAMVLEPRALAIVNRTDHAAVLYSLIKERLGGDRGGLWHLSARMCPQHRLEVLRGIRDAIEGTAGCCRVVSTQLVEAGVDLDFPVVFRAMAPLDAIAQAAGRCDREGRETARLGRPGGRVIVFEPDVPPDKALPRGEYEEATPITRAMAETGDLSIDNPDHVRAFFSRYYGGADLDPRNIQALRSQLDFPAVWEQFELIERDTRAVLVPYDATAQNLIRRLTFAGGESAELLRHLQRYQVGLRPWVFAKARDMHAVYEIGKDSDVWVCGNNFYSKEMGFHLGGGEILIA